MAVSVLQRPGQSKGTGDELALFLKKYAGRSLAAQARLTTTEGLFATEEVVEGKTAQFIVNGRTTSNQYVAGQDLISDSNAGNSQPYLKAQAQTEVLINFDRPELVASTFDRWERAITHYPEMERMVSAHNDAIARRIDQRRLITIGVGARAAANLTELGAGYRPSSIANLTTDVDVLLGALLDAKTSYDARHIPMSGRMAFMGPELYNFLASEAYDRFLNRDYLGTDGNGNAVRGDIMEVYGWRIIMSTNMPSTNITADPSGTGTRNTYTGDFSDTKVLLATPESIGVATLADMGMSFEAEYRIETQGLFMVTQRTQGCAPLRVEECGELATA
jgi:hypothetical protein